MFHLLWAILTGAFVGWIASSFMDEEGGFLKNAVIGIIGSGIANFICDFIGIYKPGAIVGLACNVLGACLFIYIVRKLN